MMLAVTLYGIQNMYFFQCSGFKMISASLLAYFTIYVAFTLCLMVVMLKKIQFFKIRFHGALLVVSMTFKIKTTDIL